MRKVLPWLPFAIVAMGLFYLNSFDPSPIRQPMGMVPAPASFAHEVGWPAEYAHFESTSVATSGLNVLWRRSRIAYLKLERISKPLNAS